MALSSSSPKALNRNAFFDLITATLVNAKAYLNILLLLSLACLISSECYSRSVYTGIQTATVALTNTTPSITQGAQRYVVFKVTVSGESGMPTGTITFKIDGQDKTPVPLSSGTASLEALFDSGDHTIIATYSGDSNYASAASTIIALSFPKFTQSVSIPFISPVIYGNSPGINPYILRVFGFNFLHSPAGEVSIVTERIDGAPLTTPLSVGLYKVTVTIAGDINFTSASAQQTFGVTKGFTNGNLIASPASSTFGQPVTFKITMSPVAPSPGPITGTVTFEGGKLPPTTVPLVNGEASLTTSVLEAGKTNIRVVYNGNDNFLTGGANLSSYTVAKANTTTTISSAKTSFVYGESASFTANVSSSVAGVTPNSSVTFSLDNGLKTFNMPLTNGQAVLTMPNIGNGIPALTAGAHTINVSYYHDDNNFNTSTSQTINFNVAKAPLTVKANDASKVYGAALPSFTASYSGFVNGDTTSVISGSPNYTTTANTNSPVGTYSITPATGTLTAANYSFVFADGVLTITKAPTNTSLTSSPKPSAPGQSITLQATVSSNTGTPDGMVEFFEGNTSLGTATLANGSASFLVTGSLALGNHVFKATYLGSTNFTGSTSATINHTVQLPCETGLNSAIQGFTETGGNETIPVTVNGSCNWEAISNANWIIVTGYSLSNKTVDYTVLPLTFDLQRTGTITIGTKTFTVIQQKTTAATSGATFLVGNAAPEEIVTAFGTGLSNSIAAATTLPLPTSLGGIQILVRDSQGMERVASLFYVSPTQINYLIPAGTSVGIATVIFLKDGRTISTSQITVASIAPGIFTFSQDGRGVPAAFAIRIKANNDQVRESLFELDSTTGFLRPRMIDLGPEGETVILEIYATGIRGRSSQSAVSVTIGGVSAEVLYADKQPQFVGLDQVNVKVPRNLLGRGEIDLVMTVNGQPANTVKLYIK